MTGKGRRKKGITAEREVIDFLQPLVEQAWKTWAKKVEPPLLQRNTLQSDRGGSDITGFPWLAMEVKHQAKPSLAAWWAQCTKQAKRGQVPILFYKLNRQPWRVRLVASLSAICDTRHEMQADVSMEDFGMLWAGWMRQAAQADFAAASEEERGPYHR